MNVRFLPAARTFAAAALGAAVLPVFGGGLQPQGTEMQLTRGIPGDQVNPAAALGEQGGWVVWQDAAIDGKGLGVAGAHLSAAGEIEGKIFQVNEQSVDDQENPAVALAASGRAFVVWQGGAQGFQRIYGRILGPDGHAVTGDLPVSSASRLSRVEPAVVALADGTFLVAWSSHQQDDSYSFDVYGRRFSASGEPLGDEFRLNATSGMNRRSPALSALPDGGFLAAWVAERQVGVRDRGTASIGSFSGGGAPVFEVAAVVRRFAAGGSPAGGEQKASDLAAHASHPALATLPDGRSVLAWTRRDPKDFQKHYDVATRVISLAGVPEGDVVLANVTTEGDQFRPRLSSGPHGIFCIWTSMGQDGSSEGVFGRWLDDAGQPSGDEIPVNGQTGGGQIFPTVATSPASDLLVLWSSNLPRVGMELFGQRYTPLLLRAQTAAAGRLRLAWPTVVGGVYQLQSSPDGHAWSNVGAARTASASEDATELSVSGQVVLYRVVRAR